MKGIPGLVSIGPLVYDVLTIDDLKDDDGVKLDGWIKHSELAIYLDAALPVAIQKATLLHEIMHAVFTQAGHRKWATNEELTECIALGVAGVVVDGLPLIGFWSEGW